MMGLAIAHEVRTKVVFPTETFTPAYEKFGDFSIEIVDSDYGEQIQVI